jgi:hypothetical protein
MLLRSAESVEEPSIIFGAAMFFSSFPAALGILER